MTNNTNMTYEFDQYSRHYIVCGTRILFANFTGAARQYNNEGRRNFHVVVPEELAQELADKGVYIHKLDPRNEGDDYTYTLKISVYEDAEILMLSGRNKSHAVINNSDKSLDMGPMIDKEFAKGHVMNGNVDIEFHVARNTKVANSSPYLRVDMLVLPLRKSKLAEAYENYGGYSDYDDDEDDLPM